MRRVSRFTVVGIVFLGGLIGSGGWLFQWTRLQTCTFADGTTMTLTTHSFGKLHIRSQQASPWWKVWRRNQQTLQIRIPSEALGLWFDLKPSPKTLGSLTRTPNLFNATLWDWAEIRDEQGYRTTVFPLSPEYCWNYDPGWSQDYSAYPHHRIGAGASLYERDIFRECTNFPRRGQTLTLSFHKAGVAKALGTFTLPNPLSGPFPTWQPEKLPAMGRQGDLIARLEAVRWEEQEIRQTQGNMVASLVSPQPPWPAPWHFITKTPCLRLRVTLQAKAQNAPPTVNPAWYLRRIALEDPTGNLCDVNREANNSLPLEGFGEKPVSLDLTYCGWCEGEKVGRLRLEMSRKSNTVFPLSEQQRLTGLTVPPPQTVSPPLKVSLEGTPAEVILIGEGNTQLMPRFSLDSPAPLLAIKFQQPETRLQPLILLSDEHNQRLQPYSATNQQKPAFLPFSFQGNDFGATGNYRVLPSPTGWQSPLIPPLGSIGRGFYHNSTPPNGPYWLFYALGKVPPGTRLRVSLAANPVKVLTIPFAIPPH